MTLNLEGRRVSLSPESDDKPISALPLRENGKTLPLDETRDKPVDDEEMATSISVVPTTSISVEPNTSISVEPTTSSSQLPSSEIVRSGSIKANSINSPVSPPGATASRKNLFSFQMQSTNSIPLAPRKSIKKGKSDGEVLVGTPVKEGHSNFMLMYDMLTGIRISVSRCNAKIPRELVPEDFTSSHKLAFDITGNELTPSSKYDFKFKDYAPWVFRRVRECFHVDPAEYLLSLTGKYVLSELGSPGKSGSFFYFSQDYRFIIKTIHHTEHKFIIKILKEYYDHVRNNPHTLISRIFGLHRVKLPGKRKIHFVVMGNVFPPHKDIHEIYDLKGSTIGRSIPDEEAKKNPRAVMKDLNWIERGRKLFLGPERRKLLIEQMERDVQFLMRLEIMDYSFLIGLHDAIKGNKDNIRDQTLSMVEPIPDSISRKGTLSYRMSRSHTTKHKLNEEANVSLNAAGRTFAENAPPEYFRVKVGDDTAHISAVNPQLYGTRFLDFMKNAITGLAQDTQDLTTPLVGVPHSRKQSTSSSNPNFAVHVSPASATVPAVTAPNVPPLPSPLSLPVLDESTEKRKSSITIPKSPLSR